ncbi:Cys-Gln thioester bond-forming surface protein [Glycomyces paridis]|uniref:LPXTG cell wall anchor domain-containing protein n=1 Tax=Glycomyces paridis TaxID=2126555 RepID=A0A4S8PDL0_9ACTN|nr:Cys-Gln thioester bond-forming surface protein [Glycomyces paridis]THV27645.1 LPXTG cell wall anchor domain-containing protein [Glycomyces paridis]
MMTKALKGTLAAAAGLALALGGAAAGHAQDGDNGASGSVGYESGILLNGQLNGSAYDVEAKMRYIDLGDGEQRTVYCIQIEVGFEEELTHEERPWDQAAVDDPAALPEVLGVLVNGYNGTNAGAIIDAAGAGSDAEDPFDGYTADQVAYAGTQAAIWTLTDGWASRTGDPTGGGSGADTAVALVMNYLLDNSPPVDEPDFEPYFEIDETAAAAEGTTVGPYTVDTNLDGLTFAQPEGAKVVDENGEEVTEFTDDLTFYVELSEAASTTVTLVTDTFTWTIPAGRTFVPVEGGEDVPGQRLILAEQHTEEYTADFDLEITVEAVPSESPKPQLPVTGSSLTTVASVGGAVLLAGIVAMVLMRRRRAANWGSEA